MDVIEHLSIGELARSAGIHGGEAYAKYGPANMLPVKRRTG